MTDETEEELDLNDLDDTELVEQMHDDLTTGFEMKSSREPKSYWRAAGQRTRYLMLRL